MKKGVSIAASPFSLKLFAWWAKLPLPVVHFFGAAGGVLAWALSARIRGRMRENLDSADLPGGMGFALANAVELGKGVAEAPVIWLRPLEQVVALLLECRGWELVEAARARGQGIVFLTPHLGCFEITSLYYGQHGPITVLYRPPKLSLIQPLIEAGRARGGVSLAPADVSGVRQLLKALKRGEAVGILPDQVPGKGEGIRVPFFGRPAYTMTLAARLIRGTGAIPILAFGERLPWGRGYRLHLRPLVEPIPDDARGGAEVLNRAVEGLVRQKPDQYLWSYNRYKIPAGEVLEDSRD